MPEPTFTPSDDIAAAVIATEPAQPSSGAQPQPAEKPAAAATVLPAAEPTDPHGPIPFERHEAILGKTRRDYDERLARLSWAERVDPQRVERALQIAEMVDRRDKRLLEHFQSANGTEPQPDARDERGELYYTPQQAAKWADWKTQQARAELAEELDNRLTPIEAERASNEKMWTLNQQIERAAAWPGFADNVEAVTATLREANQRQEPMTIHEAYINAVVIPKLAASREQIAKEEKQKWLAELNSTTAKAQTELNPGRTTPAASRKKHSDMSWGELIEEEVAKQKARAS